MQNDSSPTENSLNCFYAVAIHDFFGPQEPKVNLVQASTKEEAKLKTRMGNPDLIKGFVSREDAVAYLDKQFGAEWSEL
jgi:hypothetical protein